MKKYRRIILVWISICCGIILAACGEKETEAQEEDTRITEDKTELNEEKFYEMTEECKEPSIDYAGPIRVMQEIGWEGCISSEYEGQRDYFDIGCDIYMDPVEQCRRHHMMLKRLLGEA